MSKSGLNEALVRGSVLVFIAAMMFVGTIIFFEGADESTIQVVRMSSLFPFAIAIVDVLTVMNRRDTRNPLLVFVSASVRSAKRAGKATRRSFGRDEKVDIDESLIHQCDRCGRKEQRGMTVEYENPYRLFGVPVKDAETKEREYCNACVNKPTFEVAPDDEWGRTDAVADELNRYYDRNR